MLSGIRVAAGGAWIKSPCDPVLALALTSLAVRTHGLIYADLNFLIYKVEIRRPVPQCFGTIRENLSEGVGL